MTSTCLRFPASPSFFWRFGGREQSLPSQATAARCGWPWLPLAASPGPAGAALSKLLLLVQLFAPEVSGCVLWFPLLLAAFTSATLQNTKKQPRLLLPEEKDRNGTKMLRRRGQCAFSKTQAAPRGLPGYSSVGQPWTERRAVPADGNSPQSLPRPPHDSGRGHRCPSRAAGSPGSAVPEGSPGSAVPAGWPRERGQSQRQCRRVLPPRSGPLKREWGGPRQPTSWKGLLNMQMDSQEVRSNTSVRPPSLLCAALVAPGASQARAIRCRAAGCPGGQRPRGAILAWNLAASPIQDSG